MSAPDTPAHAETPLSQATTLSTLANLMGHYTLHHEHFQPLSTMDLRFHSDQTYTLDVFTRRLPGPTGGPITENRLSYNQDAERVREEINRPVRGEDLSGTVTGRWEYPDPVTTTDPAQATAEAKRFPTPFPPFHIVAPLIPAMEQYAIEDTDFDDYVLEYKGYEDGDYTMTISSMNWITFVNQFEEPLFEIAYDREAETIEKRVVDRSEAEPSPEISTTTDLESFSDPV